MPDNAKELTENTTPSSSDPAPSSSDPAKESFEDLALDWSSLNVKETQALLMGLCQIR